MLRLDLPDLDDLLETLPQSAVIAKPVCGVSDRAPDFLIRGIVENTLRYGHVERRAVRG